MEKIYRWLLALYPKAFLEEYGREMTLAFQDGLRHASGRTERLVVLVGATAGVFNQAPREHLAMLRQDVRYAWRTLRQSPGFAAAAIVTLALGIGASTAVFSVIDAMLIRPLPYPEAHRLVMLWEKKQDTPKDENVVAPANLFDWRARSRTLERMAMFRPQRATVLDAGDPAEVQAQSVDREFFPALRVIPHRGRLIEAEDDRPGAPPVAVISHRLWQQRFGGDEQLFGRTLRVNATAVTIVGVLPPGFQFMGADVDLWSPIALNEARDWRKEAGRFVHAFGRLKAGVSVQEAQRELSAIARQLETEYPAFNTGWGVNVVSLRDQVAGKLRRPLWVLLAAVGLLLVIACANVANLLLARAATRQREMAVRLALGASRARLVRLLLTESLLLSLVGTAGGVALAAAGVEAFLALRPVELGSPNAIAVDARVLLFSVTLAVVTGMLFGLTPAFASFRTELQRTLKEGRGATGHACRLRGAFVVAQCALTVVLLVGAGLLLRSFLKLQAQEPGLDASRLLTMRVSLPPAAYPEPERRVQFFERVIDALKAVPGVQSASATAFLPFTGEPAGTWVSIAGQPAAEPGKELLTLVRVVMPGYFETMGIPVLEGRSFTRDDNRAGAPLRFVVNQEFVRRFLKGAEPLRTRISVLMRDSNPYSEIIGVTGDVREGALDKSPEPTAYFPHAQLAYGSMTIVVKTQSEPMTLAGPALGVIRSLDAEQPVAQVRSMEQVLGHTVARQRFAAALLIGFSGLALLLAALGVYSVLSYIVVERSQEVGVRMALGARPGDVLRLFLRQGVLWALAGLATGALVVLAFGRVLRSLLFGVSTTDVFTLAGVASLMLLVAFVATLVPGWRAAHMDPVRALRQE